MRADDGAQEHSYRSDETKNSGNRLLHAAIAIFLARHAVQDAQAHGSVPWRTRESNRTSLQAELPGVCDSVLNQTSRRIAKNAHAVNNAFPPDTWASVVERDYADHFLS